MIAGLVLLCSCNSDVPKCDDPQVIETVFSILAENRDGLLDEYGRNGVAAPNKENAKMKNIMTLNEDEKLNTCGCKGSLIIEGGAKNEGVVEYSAQKNSEGEVVVNVESAGPFSINF